MALDSYVRVPVDSTGKKVRALEDVVGSDTVYSNVVALREPETYIAIWDGITPAANKYMATLWNGGATRLVKVHKVFSFQWTQTAAVGIVDLLELRILTARTVGTTITPVALDTGDAIDASIVASHNDSVVTDGGLLRKFYMGSEEVVLTAAQTLSSNTLDVFDWNGVDGHTIWGTTPGTKPITLRQNKGLSVKNISGTVGALSFGMLFTDEPV